MAATCWGSEATFYIYLKKLWQFPSPRTLSTIQTHKDLVGLVNPAVACARCMSATDSRIALTTRLCRNSSLDITIKYQCSITMRAMKEVKILMSQCKTMKLTSWHAKEIESSGVGRDRQNVHGCSCRASHAVSWSSNMT